MGTHGYYCFRYKGLYYVIYNHFDSYPDGLGEKLVTQLRNLDPQDLQKFRNIILQDTAYFEKIEQNFEKFQIAIMDDASMFNEWMNSIFSSQNMMWEFLFEKLFANSTLQIDKALSFGFISVVCTPEVILPTSDIIEWIYVIDLDNDTFLAKNDRLIF